ncbi:MAG TPA: DUF4232 domain-containing protein [Streptosporangiaceae bacterium]|jgi:hypothetical protein
MGISRRTAGWLAGLTAGIAVTAAAVTAVSASAVSVRPVSVSALARTAAPAAPAAPACPARALSLRLAGTDTAVGSTALTVALANRSAAACSLQGYPALSLARANGAPVPAALSHGSGGWFAGLAAAPVRLAPGGQASFFITYRNFSPQTGRPGPAVSTMRIGLPGVPGMFTVAARFAPYGPISVSPVRAGAEKE